MNHQLLSPFLSSKFRFWSFISMVLLVFVHGYTEGDRYLQPWSTMNEPLSATGFIEYFFANGIFRFRIPMLFIISGFLYALHDYQPNKKRIPKRFRTLFLPYLLWSSLGLAFTYAFELTPWGQDLVGSSGVVRIDENRILLHEYKWYELLVRWLLLPVPYQLWFIRVLFIYNLAYPLIRWCIEHRVARYIFFPIAFLMWLGTMGFVLIEGEGLLFFSLGILIQKKGFSIETPGRWFNPKAWGILFLALSTIKTLLAFRGFEIMGEAIYPVLTILHKVVVMSGLITCWYGLNPLVHAAMERRWFTWLAAFSFMIYALHTPLIAYAINPVLDIFSSLPSPALTTFILLPLAVIVFCVLTGAALRRFLPSVYGILTGGRGF